VNIKDGLNQTGSFFVLITVYRFPELSKPVKNLIRVPIMGEKRYEMPIRDKFNLSATVDVRPEFAHFEELIYTFRPNSQ
jgi:hypothetical protein